MVGDNLYIKWKICTIEKFLGKGQSDTYIFDFQWGKYVYKQIHYEPLWTI